MSRILSNWIDSYLEYTEITEPAETYHLWCALVVISAVLQRKCVFYWGALTFYPNIYVVLVGPPAARKGTAMDIARPFLEELDVKMAAQETTREALITALANTTETLISNEKIVGVHSSLTIWSQELTVFLGYGNLELMSTLSDWYDCRNKFDKKTKTQGSDFIDNLYVTLFGATTPDLIRSSMPIENIGSGLSSRIIYVFEPEKGKVVPLTELDIEKYKILKKDLGQIALLRGQFKYTEKYADAWIDWYVEQTRNPPLNDPKFDGYNARRATHISKLSIICCAARTDSMIIDKIDLDKANSILELTERKMTRTFSGIGKSPYAEVLEKVMSDIAMDKKIKLSILIERYRSDASAWEMGRIIDTLYQCNFLLRDKDGTDTILCHKASYLKEKEEKEDEKRNKG